MKEKTAYFVFSPGVNHICHLETVFDSIARTISIDYRFCVLLPSEACKLKSKYPVTTAVISKEHEKLCNSLYFQEGRADIQPFAAYSQLFLPHYFMEADDFLFMEVDQIVKGDLAPLFYYCRDREFMIGAVRSLDNQKNYMYPESFVKLHPSSPYYNMGVVYVNRKKWIQLGFTEICVAEAALQKTHGGSRYVCYTQGVMNNVLNHYIKEIEYKYNVTCLGYVENIDQKIINQGVILHWNGPRKPWNPDGLYKTSYYTKLQMVKIYFMSIFSRFRKR